MTVRTKWLIALAIAPVLWGVACHDEDVPTSTAIPRGVHALETPRVSHSYLALASDTGDAVAPTSHRIQPCNAT